MTDHRSIPGYGQVWEGGGELQSIPDGHRNRPLPWAIPYRTIGYFVAAVLLMMVLRHVWLLNITVSWIWAPWAYTLVPGAAAIALTKLEPHGRPATRYLWALLRHHVTPTTRCLGQTLRPEGTTMIVDGATTLGSRSGTTTALVAGTITGPAVVDLRDPMVLRAQRRRTWTARPAGRDDAGVHRVEVAAGERLVITP